MDLGTFGNELFIMPITFSFSWAQLEVVYFVFVSNQIPLPNCKP